MKKANCMFITALMLCCALSGCASSFANRESSAPTPTETTRLQRVSPPLATNTINDAKLTVQLTFNRAGTMAANQYAVWIENANHELVKTLYVSDFTANGGYRRRSESLPTWVAKANPAKMEAAQIDAISSATPQSGVQNYSWNGTDENGEKIVPGEYHLFVEGTLYWTSSVLFSGAFTWGGAPCSIVITPSYTEPDNETNKDMITQVAAEYTAGI